MSGNQYWWRHQTTLLLLGLNLTYNYCPSATKGPMLYFFPLCKYLYKLYVYNLCHVHSAIHVSLSVIQQSATRSGNNPRFRCDQQLTEQLDHHICSISLMANKGVKSIAPWLDERKTCYWRRGQQSDRNCSLTTKFDSDWLEENVRNISGLTAAAASSST